MERLPAVNYLTFPLGVDAGVALRNRSLPAQLEISHPDYPLAIDLPLPLREELARDLES
jgi:hypothetical protein